MFKVAVQTKNSIRGTFVALSIMATLGCNQVKSTDSSLGSIDSSGLTMSLSCAEGSVSSPYQSSSQSKVQVNGPKSGQVGSKVAFKLSDNAGCSGATEARWIASQKASIEDNALVTEYSVPGQYQVGAALTTSDGQNQTLVVGGTVIVGQEFLIVAPQIGFEGIEVSFRAVAPSGSQIQSVSWNFGDGSPSAPGVSVGKFFEVGEYTVQALITDANNNQVTVSHAIQILPFAEELFCAQDLAITGPAEVPAGNNANFRVIIPSCLASFNPQISWDMNDGTVLSGSDVNHTYSSSAERTIQVTIELSHPLVPSLTLTHDISVRPSDLDLHKCQTIGETRVRTGATTERPEACGVHGTKTKTFAEKISERCDLVGDYRDWVTVSTVTELVSETQCTAQSCLIQVEIPTAVDLNITELEFIDGRAYLRDGRTATLFSDTRPSGTCSSVSQTISCSNGVSNQNSSNNQLYCVNGCGDFGSHGTTQTAVNVGEVQVPKSCQFGEAGVFDVFTQIADKKCENGTVSTTNIRNGTLQTAGVCPVYKWTATGKYTECSANCGGFQKQIYECRDQAGAVVDSARCVQMEPQIVKICDGNPDAVRRTDSVVSEEQANQSVTCPANQIGVVMRYREVTKTTQYACINHEVGVEKEDVQYGPWVEEKYCRDYVAKRCNHDSLSVAQAEGRYKWMVKCQDQVPMIKEFLNGFDDVKVSNVDEKTNKKSTWSLNGKGRKLYPTFMNRAGKVEKVWKAPTNADGSCEVPETVYIAAVCVASCATPEQEILSQAERKGQLKNHSFLEALTNNHGRVATLASNSSMSNKQLRATKVDQWVTELVDSEHQILNFKMRSGGSLRITTNHPLVAADGTMKIAEDFVVGDLLVKLGGERDEVIEIIPEVYFGKVYNLFVKSNALHHNIVVTNGYLNGTAFYQNEGAKHLNKALFRKKVIKGAIPSK